MEHEKSTDIWYLSKFPCFAFQQQEARTQLLRARARGESFEGESEQEEWKPLEHINFFSHLEDKVCNDPFMQFLKLSYVQIVELIKCCSSI